MNDAHQARIQFCLGERPKRVNRDHAAVAITFHDGQAALARIGPEIGIHNFIRANPLHHITHARRGVGDVSGARQRQRAAFVNGAVRRLRRVIGIGADII
ncbi:hypothetical protein D3C75_472770 [compost metagenome]